MGLTDNTVDVLPDPTIEEVIETIELAEPPEEEVKPEQQPEPTIQPQPQLQPNVQIATADQQSVEAQKQQLAQTKVRGLFRVQSVVEEELWLKAIIYGQWGAGKTTLGATADEITSLRDVLFINAEAGALSLRKRFPHLDSIPISNFTQFSRIHEYLGLHCKARDANDIITLTRLESIVRGVDPATIKTPKKYRTVVIDSLSEIQRYAMMALLGITLEQVALDYPPESPGYQQWGQSGEQILTLVRVFRNLPLNVIFICSQKEEQDETKRYHYKVDLPGKLAGKVQGFVDVVGYLSVVSQLTADKKDMMYTRRLFLAPTPFFDAKNRIGNKTTYIDDPTIEKLLAAN